MMVSRSAVLLFHQQINRSLRQRRSAKQSTGYIPQPEIPFMKAGERVDCFGECACTECKDSDHPPKQIQGIPSF